MTISVQKMFWQLIMYLCAFFMCVVSRAGRYVQSTYLPARETTHTNTRYAATTFIIMKYSYFLTRDLTRNYMYSLMMISDMLSKHVGAMKVF
jgi:hypothetical protein